MPQRIFTLALIFFVLTTLMPSCSKYEEGPGISFVSKKERVANDWAFKSAIEDGYDVTADYTGAILSMDRAGSASLKIQEVRNGDRVYVQYRGNWLFESNKQRIVLNLSRNGSSSMRWSFVIHKLKETEMHLVGVELDRDWILVSDYLR